MSETYVCRAGECFDSVALAVYGDEKYAAELLCANPKLCRIPVFEGGEELLLPVLTLMSKRTALYVPDRAPWKEAGHG